MLSLRVVLRIRDLVVPARLLFDKAAMHLSKALFWTEHLEVRRDHRDPDDQRKTEDQLRLDMMQKQRHAYHQISLPIQTGDDDDLKHTRRDVIEADTRIEGCVGRGSKGSVDDINGPHFPSRPPEVQLAFLFVPFRPIVLQRDLDPFSERTTSLVHPCTSRLQALFYVSCQVSSLPCRPGLLTRNV
jgi:hypothetical protein